MIVFIPVFTLNVAAGHGDSAEMVCLVGSAWPYGLGRLPPAFSKEEACNKWIRAHSFGGGLIRAQALNIAMDIEDIE